MPDDARSGRQSTFSVSGSGDATASGENKWKDRHQIPAAPGEADQQHIPFQGQPQLGNHEKKQWERREPLTDFEASGPVFHGHRAAIAVKDEQRREKKHDKNPVDDLWRQRRLGQRGGSPDRYKRRKTEQRDRRDRQPSRDPIGHQGTFSVSRS